MAFGKEETCVGTSLMSLYTKKRIQMKNKLKNTVAPHHYFGLLSLFENQGNSEKSGVSSKSGGQENLTIINKTLVGAWQFGNLHIF